MHSLDLVEVHRFLAAQLPRTPHLKHHFKRHFRQSAYISPWRSENAATFLFSPRSLAKNYSKTLLSWVHRKKAQLPIVLVPEIRHGNDYAFTVSLQHGCPTATQHWSTQVRRWRSSKHQSFFTIATPVEELARRKPHRSRPKIFFMSCTYPARWFPLQTADDIKFGIFSSTPPQQRAEIGGLATYAHISFPICPYVCTLVPSKRQV